jgi:hypothetical protein
MPHRPQQLGIDSQPIVVEDSLLDKGRQSVPGIAGNIVPVGKETDRRWEQGEDPSMVDCDIYVYEKRTKLVIADPSERKRWFAIGVRRLMRKSGLSQKAVYKILARGVRSPTNAVRLPANHG